MNVPTTFGDLRVSYRTPHAGLLTVLRAGQEEDRAAVDNTATTRNFALDQTALFLPQTYLVRILVNGKREEKSFATRGSSIGIYLGPLNQGIVLTPNGGGYTGFFRVFVGRTVPGEELGDPDAPGFSGELIPNAPVLVTLRVLGQDIVLPNPELPISGVTNALGHFDCQFTIPLQFVHDLLPPGYDPHAGEQPPRALIVRAWSSMEEMAIGGEVTPEVDLAVLADRIGNDHWTPLKSSGPTLRFPIANSTRWTPVAWNPFVIGTTLQGFSPTNADIAPSGNKMCLQEVVREPGSFEWVPKGAIQHLPLTWSSGLQRWVTSSLALPSGRYCAWSFIREVPSQSDVGGTGLFFWVRKGQ